jgi:alpha-ketoglutaric semialdehyde dehydrogenase
MKLTGKNLIGSAESAIGSRTFEAINPATSQALDGSFVEATSEEIDNAVNKAAHAFVSYREKTNEERATFLDLIGEGLLALGDELIERCMLETALPEARLAGERMRTVNQLRLFAQVVREGSWIDTRIDTAIPDRQPIPKPDIRQMQIPLGPVGIFGASNFPLAFSVAGGDTASALAAGCPVIVKAHPLHPGTSELVGKAIIAAAQKAKMPDGVFSMVQGTSIDVGMAIVNHPQTTAIGFTGSYRGGKAIFDAANQRPVPIPVFAEMGSSNPVFVLPGAVAKSQDKLAAGLVASLNLGVGQFCTNPGLLITPEAPESQSLLTQMAELIKKQADGTMLSAGIKANYVNGTTAFKEHQTVELIASSNTEAKGNQSNANIFRTSGQDFMSHPNLAEEVFGPSMLSVVTTDKEELIQLAKGLSGHLTATIHGTEEDLKEYSELISILQQKVGRLIFNGYPTGVEVCHSMVHGGPFPATTAVQSTSVGTGAIRRFSRPVCFQDFPQEALPQALRNNNPLNIWRLWDGELRK